VLLNIVNRLMAGSSVVAEEATPSVTGRMMLRYALGLGLRVWGDGILNRAAEQELDRIAEATEAKTEMLRTVHAELAAARAQLEHARGQLVEARGPVAGGPCASLDCAEDPCNYAPDGGNHPAPAAEA
jgi:hypothetical protein